MVFTRKAQHAGPVPRRRRSTWAAFALVTLVAGTPAAQAADTWTQVRSEHFTVVSNGGENQARNVAWQFEQIRLAIRQGWPWTRVDLDRPVVILAVKDPQGMKLLAPDMFEGKNADATWTSIFGSTGNRHTIALRSDLLNDDTDGLNPYVSAYRSYSQLALSATFGPQLPLWLGDGFSGVLSNSIVRRNRIHFGRPLPEYTRQVRSGSRLHLRDLLSTTVDTPYYRDPVTRYNFNAQAWGFVQYLLFGDPEADAHIPKLMQLVLQNTPAVDAVQQVYGKLETLESQYLLYLKNGFFRYATLKVESDVTKVRYPGEPVSPARLAALRAGFHLARQRQKEFQAAIVEARALEPSLPDSYDIEGLGFEYQGKLDEAEQAYAKAAELGSTDFHTYFRLAAMRGRRPLDRGGVDALVALLNRAVTLNPNSGASLDYLATIYERQNSLGLALDFASRAAKAEPPITRYWLTLARVLSQIPGRKGDARTVAEDALRYASDAAAASSLRELVASLDRPEPATNPDERTGAPALPARASTVAGDGGPSVEPGGPSAGNSAPPPASAAGRSASTSTNPALGPDRRHSQPPAAGTSGTLSSPPKIRKRVEPSYPAGLDRSKDFGTVIVEITIAPDGTVVRARIQGQPSKFDAAALEAVKQWVYEPTLVEGQPVGVIMEVPVNFGY